MRKYIIEALKAIVASPLIAYHGSSKKFKKFDPQKVGTGFGSLFGAGIYFTSDKKRAATFGPIVTKHDISSLKFFDIIKDKKTANKVAKELGIKLSGGSDDFFSQLISGLYKADMVSSNEPESTIVRLGFDGVSIKGEAGSKIKPGETWYIVYNISSL